MTEPSPSILRRLRNRWSRQAEPESPQFFGPRTANIATRSNYHVQCAAVARDEVVHEVVEGRVLRDVHEESMRMLDRELDPKTKIDGTSLQVVKKLGAGTWSSVFCVEDLSSNRKYALRILLSRGIPAEAIASQLPLLKALRHPNLVQVHDWFPGTFGSLRFLCIKMDYAKKGTLQDYISEKPRALTPNAICDIMVQLTDAVAYLHRQEVIHGDLRPANVLRCEGTAVKLGGLANSCQVPRKANAQPTITGGSRVYAPPEWANSVSPFRPLQPLERPLPSYDMWSLGCVLSELVTGVLVEDRLEESDSLANDATALREVKAALRSDHEGMFGALGSGLLDSCPDERMEITVALGLVARLHERCVLLSSRQRRILALIQPSLQIASCSG